MSRKRKKVNRIRFAFCQKTILVFLWFLMTDAFPFFSRRPNGLRLAIKAKPAAKRPGPPRLVETGSGGRAVEIAVAAPPVDGQANESILDRLAKGLGVKKTALCLKSGQTGKIKQVEIAGDPAQLEEKVKTWLGLDAL